MTPARKIGVIVNPRSAGGRTARRWPQIAQVLEQRIGRFTPRFTRGRGDAIGLTRELLAQKCDLIIGVGGDGTFNEIANGFIQGDKLVRPGASMGILPAGTGGDFRRMFGFSSGSGVADAIELLAAGRPVPIDVGKVKFATREGKPAERYFVNLVSFGMGGAVAARARNFLTPLGGKLAFLWATFCVLLSYRGKSVRVRVDGSGHETVWRVTNVAVGNGRFHGGGMYPCPTAEMNDGIFEVTIIEYMNMFQLLRDIGVLYSGEIYTHPKTHHLRGVRIEAESEAETLIEVDGEPLGMLPLEITVLPGILPVIAA